MDTNISNVAIFLIAAIAFVKVVKIVVDYMTAVAIEERRHHTLRQLLKDMDADQLGHALSNDKDENDEK